MSAVNGDADATPRLEARGLTKQYGPVRALHDVSFELYPGEVVGLIGDNGAGKSTLVKLISGKEVPDDGELLVDGRPRSFHSPSAARSAGVETVYQTLSLIPGLDVVDNLYLNREKIVRRAPWRWLRLVDRRAMQREAHEGFRRLDVRLPPLRTRVSALSGGQRQAVAIARAAHWGSHVIVLDEPTAALGVRQSESVLSLVERLREHGLSIIYVTHNLDHVMRICDRIVVLRLGSKTAELRVADVEKLTLVAMMSGAYVPPQADAAA